MHLTGLARKLTETIGRIADGFVEIDKDEPRECTFCGDRARPGQRFCDEHESEFTPRHPAAGRGAWGAAPEPGSHT